MSRIVFLDFDGVLNSRSYLDRIAGSLTDEDYLTQSPELLDRQAVARLGELVLRSGSKVIVTSTWRIRRTTEELEAVLRQRGFRGDVAGKTAEGMLDTTRAGEIARWLRENGARVTSFVVLDDDPSVREIEGKHVIVEDGLKEEDCRRALRILIGDDPPQVPTANLLTEWQDFVHIPEPGRISTKAERFDLRLATAGGWVMTRDFVFGLGVDDELEGLRVDSSGNVQIWTREHCWGLVRNPPTVDRFQLAKRNPTPSRVLEGGQFSSEWSDFIVYPDGYQPLVQVSRRARFDVSRKEDRARVIRRDSVISPNDAFETMWSDAFGNVCIWTTENVIRLCRAGGIEVLKSLRRHPYD